MPKFTTRIQRNRKNRTYKNAAIFDKKGGEGTYKDRKGIIDVAADKFGNAASAVVNKVQDVGLYALGLQRINKSQNQTTENVDSNIDKIGDAASGIVSDVGNVVNKTSTSVVDNANNALCSNSVSENIQAAAEKTANITSNLAEKFNDAMDNPEVKEKVEKAIEHAADIGTVVVKSAEKPLQEAVIVGVNAGNKALGAASSGAVRVVTDIAAAVPGLGAIIDFAKALNDGSRAFSAVVEAGSEAVGSASDAFMETSKNVKQGLKELSEKKKMSQLISNRTTKSIDNFENPLPVTPETTGGSKTRRRFFKRKAKSKRVRFAI
jgi:hypothetical protein